MKDKVVLVTGGSRGIGLAAAQEFAVLGAKVIVLHSRKTLESLGGGRRFAKEIITDVADEKQVKAAVDSVVAEFEKIDILVNSAGIAIDKDWDERTLADWRKTFEVNLLGTWLMSKYVGEVMIKNKYGKIVNISSTNDLNDFSPYSVDYNASKAAVISLTKSLAAQFAPFINVNALAPGWVNTDMNKDLPADYMAEEMEKVCLKRIAEPSEMAKIIRFLASDEASYINGAVIVADGGSL